MYSVALRSLARTDCVSYQLDDEVPLVPRALRVVDGNYSVKRVADAGLVDVKTFTSDYILSREYVDQFKDEVTHRAQPGDTAEVRTAFRHSVIIWG